MTLHGDGIRGIVFDLDGTLYVCERFAAAIYACAEVYMAGVLDTTPAEARELMAATRQRLIEQHDALPTISATCVELGGKVPDLHRFFQEVLRPEEYLVRDQRVVELLQRLSERYVLYLHTNNNRVLTARILDYLGIAGFFSGVVTIEDEWRGKPDEEMTAKLLRSAGLEPHEALFVGDRYDVDLRVPEQLGCPVYLSRTIEQLMRLEELLQ